MSLARNSAPFAFRSFGRVAPTTEQLRQELEKSFNYTHERLNSLEFGNVRGSLVESQSPFVTAGFSSIRTELADGDSANAERIDALSATILNPRTGLAQAHARITLAQTVQVTANSALASQVSTVLAQVGDAQASVREERIARVDADGAVTASLSDEVTARISGDSNLSGNIASEQSARVTADSVISRNIVSTSAISGISGVISVQTSAPVLPASGDYWINNTNPADLYTYKWSGTAWVQVTNPVSIAAVSIEATARLTADGYLSGNYSLQVLASGGGLTVVTGMNITSSVSPSGGTVSSIVFRASDFKIWNSTPDTGVAMFDISGDTIRLAGTLVVSTAGKVYIGTGTFNNANTAFFVDSTGQFSLKDKLSWDLSTLSVNGSITSTSGTIGGFTLAATSLSATGILADASSPLFRIGTGGAERAEMQVVLSRARFAVYNSAGTLTGVMQGNDGIGGNAGYIDLNSAAGLQKISLTGHTGIIRVSEGSALLPTYSFLEDNDTGMYSHAPNMLGFSTNGVLRLLLTNSVIGCFRRLQLDDPYVSIPPVATGYIMINDNTGTGYKVLVSTV